MNPLNSPEHYQKAIAIFQDACDLPTNEQNAFIDRACGDDRTLRQSVESLLQHDSEACDAVEAAEQGEGLRALVASTSTDRTPTRIGQYQIARKIGQGGMGVVFEAQQEHPRRTVALKVLSATVGTEGILQRFRREADFLGQLQHAGIAQVFDAGVGAVEFESGISGQQPYIAMELIDGLPLGLWSRADDRTQQQRLDVFTQICDAVEHAHQRGVLHRDLKPGNILIDANNRPKILDFGIARMVDQGDGDATMHTRTGQLLGTVPYMSPEQVAGDSRQIDVRTDVYALGVILYELLCGRLPYELNHRSIAEAARVIQHDEPTRLSQVDRSLRGDLETIVAKALEKDRDRRYASAAALADDVRRFTHHQPIEARPASAIYNLRKFARRNKGLVVGLTATFIVLLIGAVGTSIGLIAALRANEKLEGTVQQLADANAQLEDSNATLKELADFQSSQLTTLDLPMMGVELRDLLMTSVSDEHLVGFNAGLSDVNLVDVSRGILDRTLFRNAIETIETQFDDRPIIQASLYQDLASAMRILGLYQSGVAPQEQAVSIRRRELGEEHPDTIESLRDAAALSESLGNYEDAERLMREGVALSKRVYGIDASETLYRQALLANIMRYLGKLDEAEALARQVLGDLINIPGTEQTITIESRSILAAILSRTGNYAEAETQFRRANDESVTTFGPDHHRTLGLMKNLSSVLEMAGKYEESLAPLEVCYQSQRRTLGDNHPNTIASLMELGAILERRGALEKAEAIYADAYENLERIVGKDHPRVLSTLDALASVAEQRGDFQRAEALFKDVMERRQRTLGGDHISTLRALGNYGYVLNQMDRKEDALPYYRQTLAGLRRSYGNDHPHTLTSIGNLASLLSALGQHDEADPLYVESLEGRKRTLGDDHPSTLNAIYGMGNMLRLRGELDEAEIYARHSLEGYRRVGGDDHIGTLYSLTCLGQILLDKDQPTDAEPLFREAVERRRRINGDDHPQTRYAIESLAKALDSQERWADAEEWRRLLLTLDRQRDGATKYDIAGRLGGLGKNLLLQQKHADAEAVLKQSIEAYLASESPDGWPRWYAQSLLGEAIATDPARADEAKELIVDAANQIQMPPDADDYVRQRIDEVKQKEALLLSHNNKPE